MNRVPDARAGLTIAQETIQTVLLIVVSFVSTWLGLYRIPWRVSGDPCLLAAAVTAVIVTCLWVTRWRGPRGVILERNLLAGSSCLCRLSMCRATLYWLWVEVLGTIIFVGLAVLGVKRSPWFLAIGIVLHGLAWDTWHYRNSTYIPDWYAIACLAVDLAFGAYVAARVPAYQKASSIETEN